VLARGHGYADVKDFQKAVNAWLDDHDISYVWDGETTSRASGMTTYTYYFNCVNQKDAVFAALRWA
jgi:hypothetical protein